MKQLTKIPKEWFETNHQKALDKLAVYDSKVYTVGMHTANMNVYGKVRKVILPPINVYLDTNRCQNGKMISDYIEYRIAYDNSCFPLAHIYGGTGYLCLGNIPVPRYVSPYQLMLPFETLLLYNDRYLSHGNPKLNITPSKHKRIQTFMNQHGFSLENDLSAEMYLSQDILWQMSAYLVNTYPIEEAYQLADELFQMIFTEERKMRDE